MWSKIFPIAVVCSPSLLAMGITRLLGYKQWWLHLVVSVVAGVAAGMFFALAASAMASASDPNEAKVRGALIGSLIGLINWGAVAGITVVAKQWSGS